MEIYTLYVGQGQFVVITSGEEAVVVDTYVPLSTTSDVPNVKRALATILAGRKLAGVIVTGFDADHFNEVGLRIVLNKYRPRWVMYPRYFKPTDTADTCFSVISAFEEQQDLLRISVSLSDIDTRYYGDICCRLGFEVFSPHIDDMDSSNNCSLVCKATENATGATYLITGDTENDRWDSIVRYFSHGLASNVLAAPHHGSEHGITEEAMVAISPHTVLISAGVENQYGHPDDAALDLFGEYAGKVYSTNAGNGQSLKTTATRSGVNTVPFA